MGGFYTMLQYGVLFPLGGLGYLQGESTGPAVPQNVNFDLSTAQTVRLLLGVMF